jgi:UDP-glucuronate 4-epimerase
MNDKSEPRNVLITGGAGFIGSHLVDKALAAGDRIVSLDNFNDFYSTSVKRNNVKEHLNHPHFTMIEGDLRDAHAMARVFEHGPFDVVVHLAAMAGVRPSLDNPRLYMDVNVLGTQNLIDHVLRSSTKTRFVFGSSSSVYGSRSGESFVETDRVDQPISPYAASKAANELQLHAIHKATGLEVVCLRFFTVYGPRQRPDLAIHKFVDAIDRGETIDVFGDGSTKRDYTYVKDIVQGVWAAMQTPLSGYEIINLGRSQPVMLSDMIKSIERAVGKQAKLNHKPLQTGDVPYTYASIDKARKLLGYDPQTPLDEGIKQFVEWYRTQLDTHKPVSR